MRMAVVTWVTVSMTLACGGERGPQGPQGPEGPAGIGSRTDMYCKVNAPATPVQPGQYDVTVSCDAPADLPVEGSCDQQGFIPTGLRLVVNHPQWADATPSPAIPTTPAKWICSWQGDPGPTPPAFIVGQATICCLKAG